ncbi:MAG: fluoride efflux transporter CrcB [Verrucomicrobiales bacterium]|nr:fluoride efflux transporter CrcB [Verrucomicrobiales bacterium]
MIKAVASLMLGGAFGAVSRWGIHYWIDSRFSQSPFPWGILVVNVTGCFLFGWLFTIFENRAWFSDTIQLAVFTGFLGSFTTFSTFSWNTLELLRSGQIGLALGNVTLSVVAGFLAVWAGWSLGR